MNKKIILVTGGGGFIGTNLVRALQLQYKVVVVDNFQTGNFDQFPQFLIETKPKY